MTGGAIGVNILVEGYDMDRLADEVYVYDNATDFARRDLPLPAPAAFVR